MSQQQPQLYNNLTSQLSPEEQQVIKAALEQADKLAAERAAADAAGGQIPQGGANGAS